jgi:hypothetical protein
MEGLLIPLPQRRLSSEVQSKLAERYPETDFNNCLVLVQYARHEKEDSAVFAYALAFAAGAGLLFGLPLFLVGIILVRSRNRQIHRGEIPKEATGAGSQPNEFREDNSHGIQRDR